MSDQKKEAPKTKAPEENNNDDIDQIMAELDQLQKQVPEPEEAVSEEIKEQIEEVIEKSAKKSEKEVAADSTPVDTTLDEIRAEAAQADENAPALEESFGEMKQNEILTGPSFPGEGDIEASSETDTESSNVRHLPTTHSNSDKPGTLTMTLSGNIELQLKYAQGNEELSVCFEDGYFSITMGNGAQFKVPLSSAGSQTHKKSA